MFAFQPDRRSAPYRMTGLRHNPYIGTFHGKNFMVEDSTSLVVNNVMTESKSNPLVGVFRHSPSGQHSLGLKGILYQKDENKVLSQLRVPREIKNVPIKRSFLQSLKKIPLKVYSASSIASKSSPSISGEQENNNNDAPLCAICIEPYVDGVELSTLACGHVFHRECARKWFFQGCLNNGTENSNFNCPECRQDHEHLSTCHTESVLSGHDRSRSASGEDEEDHMQISSASFYQVGRSLLNDGGYDFMSDVGSETTRQSVQSVNSPRPSVHSQQQPPHSPTITRPIAKSRSFNSSHGGQSQEHLNQLPGVAAAVIESALMDISESFCIDSSFAAANIHGVATAATEEDQETVAVSKLTRVTSAVSVVTATEQMPPASSAPLMRPPLPPTLLAAGLSPSFNRLRVSDPAVPSAGALSSPARSLLGESTYSDCGVPLASRRNGSDGGGGGGGGGGWF